MKTKKNILVFSLLLFTSLIYTQNLNAQIVQWAQQGISPGYEYGNAVTTDDSGNVYVGGQIEYTTIFNGVSLSSAGIHDIFAGKFGPDGSIKWLKSSGGTGGDVGYGIGIDAAHNSYLTGEIENTAEIGSGISLTSAGGNDIALIKYSPTGHVLWAKRYGGSGNDKGRAIAVTASGDCFITGHLSSSASFGSFSLSTSGSSDAFIVKVNSNGNVEWAKKGGGSENDRGYGIAVDKSGNVFVTGIYTGTANFGSSTISNNGNTGAYLAKYNPSGSLQWVKSCNSNNNTTESNCVSIDENGNIYIAGYFTSTADFGSHHLVSSGNSDIFVVKYDQSGSVIWAKQGGGPNEDIAYGLANDTVTHILYVTGQIDDHGYFDSHYAGGAGNRDVVIAAYDMNGNSTWAKCYGGNQRDIGYAITAGIGGYVFTTGIFCDTAYFGSNTLSGYPLPNFYLFKTTPQPATQPAIQCSGLVIANQNCNDLNLTFVQGDGEGRIVIAHAGGPVNEIPSDGMQYNSNPVFGSGSSLGSGNYVVYDGSGNNINVTGLTAGANYYFSVFEYNGFGGAKNYLSSNPAIVNAAAGSFFLSINTTGNSICAGDSITINASGALTYNWAPLQGLSIISGDVAAAFPITTTIYTITGTNVLGCIDTALVTITVKPIPAVSLNITHSVCANANPIILSGGSPSGGTYNGSGVNSGIFDPALTGPGIIPINYIYIDTNGCLGNAVSNLLVNSIPVVSTSLIQPVCENSFPFVLNNGNPTGGIYIGSGVNSGLFDPSSGSGNYPIVYTYVDSNGCADTALFYLLVNPLPSLNLGNDTTVCIYNSILIDAGSGFVSYNWSNGASTSNIFIDSSAVGLGAATFFTAVIDANGCSNSDTITITFDLCSGIENELTENNFHLFPNPFYNSFTLTADRKITANIYDVQGRLVDSFLVENSSITAGESLAPGCYLIELTNNEKKFALRVIKSY